jgi:hypothetical protein
MIAPIVKPAPASQISVGSDRSHESISASAQPA